MLARANWVLNAGLTSWMSKELGSSAVAVQVMVTVPVLVQSEGADVMVKAEARGAAMARRALVFDV